MLLHDELDSGNNLDIARVYPFDLVAEKFNLWSFNPKSRDYSNYHHELDDIETSYKAMVEAMGEMTGDKLKHKFFAMKKQLQWSSRSAMHQVVAMKACTRIKKTLPMGMGMWLAQDSQDRSSC